MKTAFFLWFRQVLACGIIPPQGGVWGYFNGVVIIAKVNLQRLKQRYITSDISYRALAKEAGVSVNSLANWGSKQGWTKERAAMKAEAIKQAKQAYIDQSVDAATVAIRASELLMRKMADVIAAADFTQLTGKRIRNSVTESTQDKQTGKATTEQTEVVSATYKDLESLVSACTKLTQQIMDLRSTDGAADDVLQQVLARWDGAGNE